MQTCSDSCKEDECAGKGAFFFLPRGERTLLFPTNLGLRNELSSQVWKSFCCRYSTPERERECVCVCWDIMSPDWAQSLRFKFQRCACLLTHVDLFQLLFLCRRGHVMCISVYMHVHYCSICLCVHGSLWWGGEPNATLSHSSNFSFSKSSEKRTVVNRSHVSFWFDGFKKQKQTDVQTKNESSMFPSTRLREA